MPVARRNRPTDRALLVPRRLRTARHCEVAPRSGTYDSALRTGSVLYVASDLVDALLGVIDVKSPIIEERRAVGRGFGFGGDVAGQESCLDSFSDDLFCFCLLYTSDAADDLLCVDLGGRRI